MITTDIIHVMLDTETWGKRAGFDLRSIGACVFAPFARHGGSLVHDGSLGTIKPFYLATDNPLTPGTYEHVRDKGRKYPLKRDPETVAWWNDPDRAGAREAFANPVDLRDALEQFTQWLCHVTGQLPFNANGEWRGLDIALWSHGPAFDPPILAEAYHACGLPVPWHYRAPRDTRTAFDMAGIDDHSAWLQRFPVGTFHHALDDAVSQAKAVCGAFGIVQGWKYGHDDFAAHMADPTNQPGFQP